MTQETNTETQETPSAPQPDVQIDLQQQFEDMKEKYLRTLAEGENARKRSVKEKQEMVRFGIENAISDFLPAIDNFENALRFAESATGEVKNWAIGFQMILAQFKEVLSQNGISSCESKGQLFDPMLHEAVEMIETTSVPEGTILEECARGYKSATRTIRPARVKVARAPKKNTSAADLSESLNAADTKN